MALRKGHSGFKAIPMIPTVTVIPAAIITDLALSVIA